MISETSDFGEGFIVKVGFFEGGPCSGGRCLVRVHGFAWQHHSTWYAESTGQTGAAGCCKGIWPSGCTLRVW